MKQLRILYVITTFPSVTETFIANQISDMMVRGHDCTIFSYNPSSDQIRHQLVMDYGLERRTVTHFKNASTRLGVFIGMLRFFIKYGSKINYSTLFSLFNPLTFTAQAAHRKAYWDLPVFLLNQKYDVIHCHFGFNGRKVAHLKKLGILSNERCVVSFHGSDLTPSKVTEYRELYQDLFTYFDAFTVNTPYLEGLLKKVQPDLSNVYILPVGFNETYLKPFLDLPKATVFTLVYCGRLKALKGPDRAIEILAGLVQQGLGDVQLMIIGEGEELDYLKVQAQQLGVDNKVRWLGAVSQEEVFKVMSTAHVFLYTGRTETATGRAETQGLVIQEAQYFKLPVVVGDVGGVKFGLQDGVTGFLIAENNLEGFVEKIVFLHMNPKLRGEMGEKGYVWVKNNFCSSQIGNKLIKLYAISH